MRIQPFRSMALKEEVNLQFRKKVSHSNLQFRKKCHFIVFTAVMMETRADIMLFRAGFFVTVSSADMCFYGKAYFVAKIRTLSRDSFKAFELCTVRYYRFIRKGYNYYFT